MLFELEGIIGQTIQNKVVNCLKNVSLRVMSESKINEMFTF